MKQDMDMIVSFCRSRPVILLKFQKRLMAGKGAEDTSQSIQTKGSLQRSIAIAEKDEASGRRDLVRRQR